MRVCVCLEVTLWLWVSWLTVNVCPRHGGLVHMDPVSFDAVDCLTKIQTTAIDLMNDHWFFSQPCFKTTVLWGTFLCLFLQLFSMLLTHTHLFSMTCPLVPILFTICRKREILCTWLMSSPWHLIDDVKLFYLLQLGMHCDFVCTHFRSPSWSC